MKALYIILVSLLAALAGVARGYGQDVPPCSLSCEVGSPLGGADSDAVFERAVVYGTSSPDGKEAVNLALAERPAPAGGSFAPRWSLKTDLLLWCGVMPGFEMGAWTPNLSAEFYFARRWSAQGGYAYSNWNSLGGGRRPYAVSAGDVEVRRWFGRASAFRGFYLGVYGQYGQYDVESPGTGNTGSFWCAGLGAGWLQPLSRHWALEAQLRGGYLSAGNDLYDTEAEHHYFNSHSTEGRFTGQLRVQVVYRFGKSAK